MTNLQFLLVGGSVVLVPLAYGVYTLMMQALYDKWAARNPEAHQRRVREYITHGRSMYARPWG